MGHFCRQWDMGVDPDATEIQTLSHAHGPAEILGPNRGSEAIRHAICPFQGFGFVRELLHGNNWTKNLILDHFIILLQVSDHRRLDVVTTITLPVTSDNY